MAEGTFIHIKKNWCKRCRICIAFCPKGVYKADEYGYPVIDDIAKCTECGICVAMCPELAILTEKEAVDALKDR